MPDRKLPTVNLDAVGALLDRALQHPIAALAGELAPDAMARIREIRDNLPDVAAGVQVRALEEVSREAVRLTRDVRRAEDRAARALGSFLDEMLTASGKRTPPARRLKPPRKAKPR